MRRNKFKRHIASLVAASMGVSLLAPQIPVWAATDLHKNIKFDLGIYHDFEGVSLPDLVYTSGVPKIKDTPAYSNAANFPLDTGFNLQDPKSVSAESLEMPWWNYKWIANDTGASEAAKKADSYEQEVKNYIGSGRTGAAPTSPSVSWNGIAFNFPGYRFVGWTESTGVSDRKVNKLPSTFPYRETIYKANYKSDGTLFKVVTKYEPKAGTTAPVNVTAPATATYSREVSKSTDDTYQTPIINIPGYKVTLDETNDIKITDPTSGNPVANKTYTDYKWTKDADNHLQGQIFNKNLEVTYKYEPDTDKTFAIDAVHKMLDENGAEKNSLPERKLFSAEADITGVGPKADLITPATVGGQARYVLVTSDDATAGSLKKAPVVTRGTTVNLVGHVAALEKTNGSYFDSNNNLVGKMPNQNVALEYVYMPNPDYKLNVTVRYTDEKGRTLTSTVLDKARTDFPSLTETSDHAIVLELNPNTAGDLPLPDLTDLGYVAPTYAVTVNALEAGNIQAQNNKLNVSMQDSSYEIRVTYNKDENKWGNLLFDNAGDASLVDKDNETEEYDPSVYPVEAEKNTADKLLITNAVAATFPTIKPKLGYKVLGYYDGDTKVVDENKQVVAGTSGTYELAKSGNDYKLTAKVEKDTLWKDYVLEYDGGENGSMSQSPKTISLYPNDASGNPRELTWTTITDDNNEEFVGLVPETTAEAGYEIRWYDPNDTQLVTSGANETDILSYPSGTKFIARAVSTAPLAVNAPSVTPSINENTGKVELKVDRLNPDPTVNYVVTDENGDIIKKLRGSELNDLHKIITDDAIRPDAKYKVYEVFPSANIGDNISETPAADRSPETEVRTPVAPTPDIVPDTDGKTKAVFEPITPGMDYAIIGPNGDVVIPWTTPTDRTFIAPNLDPETTYTIVVKPHTSSDAEPARMPGMRFETVAQSANNKIILVNKDDIEVQDPAGLDLDNVKSGTVVTLKAKPINAANDVFRGSTGWELIMGNPTNITGDGNTLYRFTMPRGNVVLRARYGSVRSNWSPATVSDAQNKASDLGTSNPDIDVAGQFRVHLERKDATPSNATAISNERAKFIGLAQLRSKVQKQNNAGVWEDYNYNGNILTSVNTGILPRDNREYVLYELVAGGDPVLAYTLTEEDYENGQFMTELKNGVEYIFGYTESDTYKLEIKDNRNDLSLANIKIRYDAGLKALSDYTSRFSVPSVGTETIGRDGVTYIYRGLSSSETSFDEVDVNRPLDQADTTIYAYYDNDKVARKSAEDELKNLIDYTNTLNSKTRIQDVLDEAKDVLNKLSPRKSSTPELKDAIDKLRRALDSLTPSNGGGSGSGGGSTTGNRNVGTQTGLNNGLSWYRTYTVGTDGSWKLLDKDSHVWAFEFNNGTRVTGWANLAYTYNGVRRVETYHFRNDGIMDYGWFKDESGRWFYMSEVHDGFFGHLIRGWYKDANDGKWYYLSPIDGHMNTGWNSIKNIWYFLSPENNIEPTWRYNDVSAKWEYIGNRNVRPLGSMYENERTPDNYFVDENGAWLEGR